MDRLAVTTANGRHDAYQSRTVVSASNYCASVFIKDDGAGFGGICFGIGVNHINVLANLTTKEIVNTEVGSTSGTIVATGIEEYGSGIFRIWVSGSIATTVGYIIPFASNSAAPTYASGRPSYTGVLGEDLFLGGAQLELGTTPSSYIKTTTAAATRVAEGFTQSLDNFSQDAGTLIGTARFPLAKADMPSSNSGVFGVRNSSLSLMYTKSGVIRSFDAINLAQASLGYLADEEVTIQVTWDSSISKFQIWGTSDSGGTVTSGLVTYDGGFVIGTVIQYLWAMGVSVNLLDWVLTKSSLFTDKTGKDS
tara:strand:- start:230 stop:1153 length:924 start_codon:yes stop_codon:yes gene_type:complete